MDLSALAGIVKRQRTIVMVVLGIGAILFIATLIFGRRYTATSTILAVSANAQESAVLDPSKDPTLSAIPPTDVPNLLKSQVVINRVARALHLTQKEAAKIQGEIKAKAGIGSAIIPVQVTDRDQHRAVAIANELTHELQHFEQEIAMSRYDLLVTDLQAQLAARRNHLHDIDQQISAISESDPYVSAETGTQDISKRIVELETQRDLLRTTTLGDASAAAVASQRPSITRDLATREIIENDPVYIALKAQYGKDLAQLTNERSSYLPSFPGLSGLQDSVQREGASMNGAIDRETRQPDKSPAYVSAELDRNKADAAYAADRAQLASLDREIADMTQHLNGSRGESLSVAALRRDRDAGDLAYASLSERLANAIADRSQAGSINPVVVIDRATFAGPSLFSRPPVLIAAFLVAFGWLAVTLAFIADGSDKRLRDRVIIEELYGSPVLASVG